MFVPPAPHVSVNPAGNGMLATICVLAVLVLALVTAVAVARAGNRRLDRIRDRYGWHHKWKQPRWKNRVDFVLWEYAEPTDEVEYDKQRRSND